MNNRRVVLTHSDTERIAKAVVKKILKCERFRPIRREEAEVLVRRIYGLKPSYRREAVRSEPQVG